MVQTGLRPVFPEYGQNGGDGREAHQEWPTATPSRSAAQDWSRPREETDYPLAVKVRKRRRSVSRSKKIAADALL